MPEASRDGESGPDRRQPPTVASRPPAWCRECPRRREQTAWMLTSGSLVTDLDRVAAETWLKLKEGDERGIRFREDSLTDHALLDLSLRHPGLRVKRFNQSQEVHTGADWEWWIGRPGRWIALRIQAKRIDGDRYNQLGYGRGGRRPQLEQLVHATRRSSRRRSLYPVVVFFNGWEASHWSGSAWPPSTAYSACAGGCAVAPCSCFPLEGYGCAFAMADQVLTRRGAVSRSRRNYAPEFLDESLPWSFLFRGVPALSGPTATGVVTALQEEVDRMNLHLALVQALSLRRLSLLDEPRAHVAVLDDAPTPFSELPAYAEEVRTSDVPYHGQSDRGRAQGGARGRSAVPPARTVLVTDLSMLRG